MDNQQDQFGTPNPTNSGRASQAPTSTPGSTGASRKPAASARSASATEGFGVSGHDTTHPGSRQGEGQQTNGSEGTLLDTALQNGKKWIEDSGVLNNANQLPQSLKDLGNRAVARVGELTTTQKVVGGALLVVGLGWLATRKGKPSSSSYNYGKQRDAGSYGRRGYGYQAPDASTGRKSASGTAGRSDSGSPYGNSSGRYANGGIFSGGATANEDTGASTGLHSGGGSGFGASAKTDPSVRPSEGGYRPKNDDSRSIE
ncbi:hypothetical protein [Hymenobacter sp.]|uniref:hypothetical protein n=1 Tax=Hymenobacter sp. TaxID=1898978 RepID=UPI00286A579A|nr:hypothetical protein [Hymenobacter sp.]